MFRRRKQCFCFALPPLRQRDNNIATLQAAANSSTVLGEVPKAEGSGKTIPLGFQPLPLGKGESYIAKFIILHNIIIMKKLKKYRCKVCKWVYDPEFGDIKGGIPANTAFEDLPADWVCPVCKAERNKFEEFG